MQLRSSADRAVAATVGIAIIILAILICVDGSGPDWLPQVVVSLAGFAGASWFVGRRLDLLDKGILQRQAAAAELLLATKRGNLTSAVKEAVNMLNGPLTSVLAGQRWLHQIATVGQEEAELVRALLCSYIAGSGQASDSTESDSLDDASRIRTRQSALKLLFGAPGRKRYAACKDAADLGSAQWEGLSFADLDLTDTILSEGDFTNATVIGACFDGSDLRETKWGGSVSGGSRRTTMENVDMRGVSASSCTFYNISFRGANMKTDVSRSVFRHCEFKNCDFEGADWTGTSFDTPSF